MAKLASNEDGVFNRASFFSASSPREVFVQHKSAEDTFKSDVEQFQRVQNFRNQNHSLRINVSDVAACGGFHWYRSLPKLMFDHIYQGSLGRDLLQRDTSLLGLEIVSDEDVWMDLAKKAGIDTREALQQVLQVKKGEKKVDTVEEAMELRQKVVKQASASKNLTVSQLATLKEGVQHCVNTGFGTFWEEKALDQYEQLCGWPVSSRNADLCTWSFDRNGNEIGGPVLEAIQYCPEAKRPKTTEISSSDQKPHFRLRGAVDGIREEMIPIAKSCSAEEDECTWIIQKVIVECKHRMNKLQASVPLYEMIQATVYCLMYNCGGADILQVLRHRSKSAEGSISEGSDKELVLNSNTTAGSNEESNEKAQVVDLTHDDKQKTVRNIVAEEDLSHAPMEIEVTRVSIDDPLYCHRQNWYGTVLPRLVLWTKAVYDIRSDDDKRYRLLASIASERIGSAWDLLHEECPWLIGCDTSYSRDVSE